MRRLLPFLTLFAFAVTAPASAQEAVAESDSATVAPLPLGTVVVETNLPDGMIYAGETPLGPAEAALFELAPGAHVLTLREAAPEAWQRRTAEASVEVRAGETVTVRLDVPYRYRVESFPYGATVTLEREEEAQVLGETPLDLSVERPLDGVLVVRKPGYATAEQTPGEAADNRYSLVLRPLDFAAETTGEVGLQERRKPNTWIDVAAVSLALGAGAVAVYYKFKGDDEYDAYARSGGDPALRNDFERYDTYSAIALGAMQVGIGVFAIRLVLR
ncbi:MAG: PEGA domain-containing protein [Rhodothermales bacterium]